GFPRLQSTALEPLYFANYLMVPLLIGLALQISGLMKKRWELIVLGVIGLAFLLTQSRGGYYSLLAGMIFLAWLLWGKLKVWLASYYKQLLLAVIGLLVISLATVAASSLKTNHNLTSAPHYLIQLFSTKLTETGSFTERVRDQELAFSIFKKHPLLGVGIGGFGSSVYGCTVGKCVYRPNNQALEVLAEGGIVGFLAFHAFLLSILYYGYRVVRRNKGLQMALAAGLTAAIVAMVIQSQSFSGFLCCLTHPWADLAILAGIGSLPAAIAEAKK
ncbi:MAG TPA: O-antigen ligase family protein, partial [Candidatus Saccharimonadia bacterium]|nr:O-antigen ligase family protein [Candidatus Saccharimonadia bacterium]